MNVTNLSGVTITTIVRPGRRSFVLFALCLGLLIATPAAAAVSGLDASAPSSRFCNGIRLEDEIVLVNVRNACASCDAERLRSSIQVERYAVTNDIGNRRWGESDLDSFLSFDASVPTVIYIHGNQMTNSDAKVQGLQLYRKLANYGSGDRPIRYVIFSWPSAKVGGLLKDVRVKALRTGPVGCELAWLIDQMPADAQVSLIGFSFGARIITGSLHILAGGELGRYPTWERTNPDRAPINAVLIASAVHAHWLGKGQYHGLAMTQTGQMFLLNNCSDMALRYYHFSTSDRSRPRALGISGPTRISSDYASKITERDVSRYAGSEHDLFAYLCAPGAVAQVWETTVGSTAAVAEPQAAN